MKSISVWIAVSLALVVASSIGCDAWKDALNEATAQDETFEKQLDDMPIIGVGSACSPELFSFDDLLSDVDWWSDAKGHLQNLVINAMDYRVKRNNTPAAVTVKLYLTDTTDAEAVTEDDYLGETEMILAHTTVESWTPMVLADDAEERLTTLVEESNTEFSICAKIPEVESGAVAAEDVDLKLGFQVSATATFVPIGN